MERHKVHETFVLSGNYPETLRSQGVRFDLPLAKLGRSRIYSLKGRKTFTRPVGNIYILKHLPHFFHVITIAPKLGGSSNIVEILAHHQHSFLQRLQSFPHSTVQQSLTVSIALTISKKLRINIRHRWCIPLGDRMYISFGINSTNYLNRHWSGIHEIKRTHS